MVQTISCIRFGEILFDEKGWQPILLCTNCHKDYGELKEFRDHLEACCAIQYLFRQNSTILYKSSKGKQITTTNEVAGCRSQTQKNLIVYDISDVNGVENAGMGAEQLEIKRENEEYQSLIDLVKIEEELLNPRWFGDDSDLIAPLSSNGVPLSGGENNVHNTTTVYAAQNVTNQRAEPRSEPQPQPRTEPQPETRTEQRPEPRSEPRTDQHPEPHTERRPEPRTEPRPEPRTEPLPEPRPEPRTEPLEQPVASLKRRQSVRSRTLPTKSPTPLEKTVKRLKTTPTRVSPRNGGHYGVSPQPAALIKVKRSGENTQLITTRRSPRQRSSLVAVTQINQSRKQTRTPARSAQTQPPPPPPAPVHSAKPTAPSVQSTKPTPPSVQSTKPTPPPLTKTSSSTSSTITSPSTITSSSTTTSSTTTTSTASSSSTTTNSVKGMSTGGTAPTRLKPLTIQTIVPLDALMSCQHPPKQLETETILKKLHNLGLEVKRTNVPVSTDGGSAADSINNKTVEILQKLKAKGMQVKVLHKHGTNSPQTPAASYVRPTRQQDKPRDEHFRRSTTTATAAAGGGGAAAKTKASFNRNLIIKKVI